MPNVGGADGGAYTIAGDLAALCDALLGRRLVGEATLARMLTPHWRTDPERDDGAYGSGIWIRQREGRARSYAMVGEDPGVAFSSTYDPGSVVLCSVLGNTVDATWAMLGHHAGPGGGVARLGRHRVWCRGPGPACVDGGLAAGKWWTSAAVAFGGLRVVCDDSDDGSRRRPHRSGF